MGRPGVFLAFICTLLLLLPATSADSGRVSDLSGSLSVVRPAGWTCNRSGTLGTKLMLIGPREHGFSVNINLVTEDVGSATIDQYAVASEQAMASGLTNARVIARGRLTVAGCTAFKLVYVHEFGTPAVQIQAASVGVIRKGVGYVFTYSALPQDHAKYSPKLTALLKSLRWLK